MNTNFKFQSILIVLIIALMFLYSADTQVSAQVGGDNDQEIQDAQITGGELMGTGLVPGGPGFIMVSAFDFRPYLPDTPWSVHGSGIMNIDPTEESNMVAGLTLPHGATLTKMTLYYRDYTDPKNIILTLFRGDGVAEGAPLANMQTSGTAFAFRTQSTTTFADPKIDNQLYSYYLLVHFPASTSSDLVLSQVRLDYDYPSYLPTVMK